MARIEDDNSTVPGDDDTSYSTDVATLVSEFYSVVEQPEVDREAAIRLLDLIGRLVAWRSLAVPKDDEAGGVSVDLYGGMEVYHLLQAGWGDALYSGESDSDWIDQRLFDSLLAVMQATDRAMAGADLNKRAYEAFATHTLHPTGRRLAEAYVGRLRSWMRLAEEQRGHLAADHSSPG